MELKTKLKLRRFIRELEKVRGRHTELVSVYIPAGYELVKVIHHLQQEQGTAINIKDAKTRKNVIDSLEKMIRHLKLFKRTPKNGLAVFAGNASETASKIDIKVWSIEPPLELKTRMYRCDHEFVLEPLKMMMEYKDVYGLIVLDRREGNIGLLKGTHISMFQKLTSNVPGKAKAGGQSAQRFARIRENEAREFYKRVGEASNKIFLGMKDLKGIIIGGPGPTKHDFLDGQFLNNQLKQKVLGVRDLSYTGMFGLEELVDRSKELLANEEIVKEKLILTKFFTMLAKESSKTVYGRDEVKKALEYGTVEDLLLSESLPDKEIEDYGEEAEKYSTKIHIISTETKEGIQLRDIGGIAGILRYPLNF